MTNKEKRLLLIKDLCAKFPYGVKGLHRGQVHELFTIDGREVNSASIQVDGYDAWFPIDTFKPYLRPMSSMTDEEREEWADLFNLELDKLNEIDDEDKAEELAPYYFGKSHQVSIDWLNKNMFDYRGLIPMGLALKAPDGMYENN